MKKHILLSVTAASLAASMLGGAGSGAFAMQDDFDRIFYEAPGTAQLEQIFETREKTVSSASMPMFKKGRITLQNYLRKRNNKSGPPVKEAHETVQPVREPEQDVIELTGGVKEHVAPNDLMLDADVVVYDPVRDEIDVTGSPVLNFPNQSTALKADKMVYNVSSNVLKAYGNVQLIRDGSVIRGDFMQLNANEETAFMDNLRTQLGNLTVRARSADAEENKIVLNNGKIVTNGSYLLKLQTSMIEGIAFDNMIIDDKDMVFMKDLIDTREYNIKAKNIIVDAKKEHNNITMKDAAVYLNDKKLFKILPLTAHTNKENDYFEANYPEFGSRANLGMFAGPGFVFDIPNGSVMKVVPLIVNKSGFGIGGAVKYVSSNNFTDLAYGTADSKIVSRGIQKLDDNLKFQYGSNSYTDDWFTGRNMSEYIAELIYDNSAVIKDSLHKDFNLNFRHRVALGFIQDGDVNRVFENMESSKIATMRAKYMAEIMQPLFSYKDIEKRKSVTLGVGLQGSAALYGTGDTQMIGRLGPTLSTQYKYWLQDIAYYQSAYEDNTPLTIFDTYRSGHSNVILREALRVNKYLTLAWRGSFNMMNDAPSGKPMQECGLFAALGPDDLKVSIGYDFIREQTYFTVAMALDLKNSTLEFERMEIKNPDRLSSQNSEKITVWEDSIALKTKMKYAQVIDIEDPQKEQL